LPTGTATKNDKSIKSNVYNDTPTFPSFGEKHEIVKYSDNDVIKIHFYTTINYSIHQYFTIK